LWPRALLTPFTDDVDLTPADRRAYAGYARAERFKGFERIDVDFDGPSPTTGAACADDEDSASGA
jgi:membrane protein